MVDAFVPCTRKEDTFWFFVSAGDGRKGEETFLTTSIAYLPLLSTPTRRMTGKYI